MVSFRIVSEEDLLNITWGPGLLLSVFVLLIECCAAKLTYINLLNYCISCKDWTVEMHHVCIDRSHPCRILRTGSAVQSCNT